MPLPNPTLIPFNITTVVIPESNYKKGRSQNPDLIVMHVVEGTKAGCIAQFQNPATQVSAHLLIGKDGSVTQFVSTANTAYGNGVVIKPISSLVLSRPGVNPNDYSISIEHEGQDFDSFTPVQAATSTQVVKFLSQKWNIPLDSTHVIRHREIDANKMCPGILDIESIIRNAKYT